MFIRFPAPPGGLARMLSVSRSAKDGEVVVTPRPSTAAQPQTSNPAAQPAAESTPSSPTDPSRAQPATKP